MISKASHRVIAVLIGLLFLITTLLVFRSGDPAPAAIMGSADLPRGTSESDPYPLSEGEAIELMVALSGSERGASNSAMEQVLEAADQRFISVFIELLRGRQLGIAPNVDIEQLVATMESLSGRSFGLDWFRWVEWYGTTDLQPPPGFTGWKGELLSIIDPGFGAFLTDALPSQIRVEEIQWGGVRVDGIPALDRPAMLAAEEAHYLEPGEPVLGIAINGDARAYPLRILDWHEMANDIIGGVPVSLAYCTLCGAAIAYDGRYQQHTLSFGSSGFLFRSNKLMYDRQTRTLWNQLTGEPVLGQLVEAGERLKLLPVVLTSWQDWRLQHPGTLVVDIDTGFRRDYTPGAAYGGYFASSETMFPVAQRSQLLDTKARVYAMRIGETPIAYPLDLLTTEQVVNDTVAGVNLVLIAPEGSVEVAGSSQRAGAFSYLAGGAVRAYERGDTGFALGADANTLVDSDGVEWHITEEALVSPSSPSLPRLAGHLAYWFGWYAFFPNTLVYGQ
jgi:hypothetical protein